MTIMLAALVLTVARGPATKAGDDVPADLVLLGPVRTLDPPAPRAEFVAVRGDRIAGLGPRERAADFVGPTTRVIELPGSACVLPGFVDAHAHVLSIGHSRRELDLVGTRSFEEIVARCRERATKLPAGTWIRGRGWDQNDWAEPTFPHHAALSVAVPDHPVCLTRVDGHAVLANAAAMRAAQVDAATSAPAGGEILRDARGEPSGVLIDAATALVESAIPPPTPAQDEEALELALREARELGVTTLHDAGAGRGALALFRRFAEQGRLSARLYVMLDGSDRKLVDEHFAAGPWRDPTGFLTVRAVKVYADGALGSRGALLLEDYADRAGHRGLALTDRATLAALSRRALDAGFQVCTHAIGDAANRIVLAAYRDALESWSADHPGSPRPDHRFRVEHAQLVAPAEVPFFSELRVIASMQTCHATSDAPWVPARLGAQRTQERAYAWRTLLDGGATICNGTDAPVEALSPCCNLYSALTRLDPGGTLEAPFLPEQRMTCEEALRTMTTAGAFAGFAESRTGTIRTGFSADLVALDVDPAAVPPSELLGASVELTIVGGRIVHERSRARDVGK